MAEVCKFVAVSKAEIIGRIARSAGDIAGQIWFKTLVAKSCQIVQVKDGAIQVDISSSPNDHVELSTDALVFSFLYKQDKYLFRFYQLKLLSRGKALITIPQEIWRMEQRKTERLLLYPFYQAYLLLAGPVSNDNQSTNLLHFDRRKMFETKMLEQLQKSHLAKIGVSEEYGDFRLLRLIDLTSDSFSFLSNQDEFSGLENLLKASKYQGKLSLENQYIEVFKIDVIYYVPMVITDFAGGKFFKIGCKYQSKAQDDLLAIYRDKLSEKIEDISDVFIKSVAEILNGFNKVNE